jgi:hypothetical protein
MLSGSSTLMPGRTPVTVTGTTFGVVQAMPAIPNAPIHFDRSAQCIFAFLVFH